MQFEEDGGYRMQQAAYDPLKGGKVDFAKQREEALKQRYRGEAHVADPLKELEDRRIQQALGGNTTKQSDKDNVRTLFGSACRQLRHISLMPFQEHLVDAISGAAR